MTASTPILEVGRKNNGSFFMSFEVSSVSSNRVFPPASAATGRSGGQEFSGSFNRIYVCPCGDRPIEAEELAEAGGVCAVAHHAV